MSDQDAKKKAKELIQWYCEGSDLTEDEEHVLYDTAAEHGQILGNVARMRWFRDAVAENIQVLELN